MSTTTLELDVTDLARHIQSTGLRNRWYGICPTELIGDGPIGVVRLGERLVVWRDRDGQYHVQEDYCPHRAAPLSIAKHLGDRLACRYHGVEVDGSGTVVSVPGMPGCALEGRQALKTYPSIVLRDALFAWFGDELHPEPAPFVPSTRLTSEEYDAFLCYVEYGTPYQFMIENNLDPMHGSYLHADSHSMSEGDRAATFSVRGTDNGFVFEKDGQRDTNFDWSEWIDTSMQYIELEIPYPATGGPGGNFGIVSHMTPIDEYTTACFFWRNRKVSGWQRDVWRFLYKNRLEARHWAVLEQDREVAEVMQPVPPGVEHFYQHDLGVTRVRKLLRKEAEQQAGELTDARSARHQARQETAKVAPGSSPAG
ncbi:MAG: aromatic ring-hydroxylating dioxygenase subunit alpha [Nocardioidaceae bacterium]|nr:aromatic ring-hydroxylating dioxygenase subunit alpha [Nocardioidaceae bacterium]